MKSMVACLIAGISLAYPAPPVIAFDVDADALAGAVSLVLNDWRLEQAGAMNGAVIARWKEIGVDECSGCVEEDRTGREPQWLQARFHVVLRIRTGGPKKAELEVEAYFERFGVPDRYLLIPCDWIAAASNGTMEKRFMDEVSRRLRPESGEER